MSCTLATLGPVGYLPAPGTFGTLCAVPVLYAMRSALSLSSTLFIVVCATVCASIVVHYALPSFEGDTDPSHIVIDESIGFALLACTMPVTRIAFAAGFVLFRFFDIVKPCGIRHVEQLEGTFGVMLDDLVAALYAALCVWVLSYFLHTVFV